MKTVTRVMLLSAMLTLVLPTHGLAQAAKALTNVAREHENAKTEPKEKKAEAKKPSPRTDSLASQLPGLSNTTSPGHSHSIK